MPRKLTLFIGVLLCGFGQASSSDDAALNPQALAPACTGCHSSGGMPLLEGMDASGFIAAMRQFQTNQRPASVMGRIARGYTEAELAAMAAYFQQHQP